MTEPGSLVRRWAPSADADDLVGPATRGHAHLDLVALPMTEKRSTDRRFVGYPALGRISLGGSDDAKRLVAVLRLDVHGRADSDVGGRCVFLVDQDGVLDQR